MKQHQIVAGLIVALMLSACNISINPVSTGALQTYRVDVPHSADQTAAWNVQLDIGSASTLIGVGGDGLLNGTVETNVSEWKPLIMNVDHRVQVRQAEFSGIPPLNAQNDWHLKIGQGIPISLTVNAGAIKGEWELGGLMLRSFDWKQGAADTTLRFTEANQQTMSHFYVDAGASTLKLLGLGNISADKARVTIGAGSLNMRFDGALARAMTVTIEGGAAAITIDSGNNQVEVQLGKSLSAVSQGDWSQNADTYQSPGWIKGPQPKITVIVKLGASSLNLVSGR